MYIARWFDSKTKNNYTLKLTLCLIQGSLEACAMYLKSILHHSLSPTGEFFGGAYGGHPVSSMKVMSVLNYFSKALRPVTYIYCVVCIFNFRVKSGLRLLTTQILKSLKNPEGACPIRSLVLMLVHLKLVTGSHHGMYVYRFIVHPESHTRMQ